MTFFRNKEVKQLLLILAVLSIFLIAAGFAIHLFAGLILLLSCLIFCIVFFIFTQKRYQNISALSEQIDLILHGRDGFDISIFNEGELSILRSDIQKMTVRLREQADTLRRDKTHLADALADISHQIRTPLTSIRMLTSFLAKADLESGERLEFSREMESLIGRIDWLLTTLLKISKIDAGTAHFEKEEFSLYRLLKKSAQPLEIPLELREISLKIDCDESITITMDTNWMAEAIGNILKNCIEHTPQGGKIEICCTQNAVFTQIEICDNGSGIDSEDLPHVFERFYQGKHTKYGSFGVGLALCRMILSAQNATVKAENHPAGGACFKIKMYHQNI